SSCRGLGRVVRGPRLMRRSAWWVGLMVVAVACAAPPFDSRPETAPAAAGRAHGSLEQATRLVAAAARQHPVLEDYVLYLEARTARSAGRSTKALERARRLVATCPDSIWVGPAWLMAGQLEHAAGELAAARASLAAARAALPSGSSRWVRATLSLADVQGALGEPAVALELARELRRARPRGLAARRARRLAERIRAAHPEFPLDHADEAEARLREGDARGAREQAEMALAEAEPIERARALWLRAQAEHAAEARWRAAFIRYLAGEMAAAAEAFARLAGRSTGAARVAAEYWQARALTRLGRGAEARNLLVHVAERHPRSYYAEPAE